MLHSDREQRALDRWHKKYGEASSIVNAIKGEQSFTQLAKDCERVPDPSLIAYLSLTVMVQRTHESPWMYVKIADGSYQSSFSIAH